MRTISNNLELMGSIKTNLQRETHFVVTDGQDRILGILKVAQGEQDITDKLAEIVKDDKMSRSVTVETDLFIEYASDQFEFDVEMIDDEDDDEEEYSNTFWFEATEVYS